MALIKCKECGKIYSSTALSCPICGAPVPEINSTEYKEVFICYWHKGRLWIGIFSIILSFLIAFQSFFAGFVNIIADTGESSGSYGMILSSLFFMAGIFMIFLRQFQHTTWVLSLLYWIGWFAIPESIIYKDLTIWKYVSLILGSFMLWCFARELVDQKYDSHEIHWEIIPVKYFYSRRKVSYIICGITAFISLVTILNFVPFNQSNSVPTENNSMPETNSAEVQSSEDSELIEISPEELITSYEANEVKGDELYEGTEMRLTGKIGSIGKDILEEVYITFEREEQFAITSVQCYFSEETEIQKVMELGSGDEITVKGYCDGKFGNVLIKDCVIEENIVEAKKNSSFSETKGFSTTLTAGHYTVGIDIPVGTYSFFSKKGTGNLYSNDGAINEIFDYENQAGKSLKDFGIENFGTEELKDIILSKGTILTVTGTQEISAGCSDGKASEMEERNQDNLAELEIGYGNFGSNDYIPSGTYNIFWLEGSGNIISDSANIDYGINEIMGEPYTQDISDELDSTIKSVTEKLYIKEYHNFTIEEGDILKIPDIKVKLVPSK